MSDKLQKIISEWTPGQPLTLIDVTLDKLTDLPPLVESVILINCDIKEVEITSKNCHSLGISESTLPKITAPFLKNLIIAYVQTPDTKEPVDVLQDLPASLISLKLKGLSSLRKISLPANLIELYIKHCNSLEDFTLPDTLEVCKINHCNLQGTFTISSNIKDLDVSNNFLTSVENKSKELVILDCSYNNLKTLPVFLPELLDSIKCNNNKIKDLPDNLPPLLTHLNINNNPVKNVLTLPPTLEKFHCVNCELINLPTLPSRLKLLHCGANKITSIPELPITLTDLDIFKTDISNLTLPPSLKKLNLNSSRVTSLPSFPQTLKTLHVSGLKLKTLPTLPSGIKELFVANNSLNNLPIESLTNLKRLDCSNNHLNKLPVLSSSLSSLICSNNQLQKLPKLPTTLEILDCSNNYLTKIPKITSEYLSSLNTSHNLLTEFPEIRNENIMSINVSFNSISAFGYISPSVETLDISFNKFNNVKDIESLPKSITTLFFDGCPVYTKMSPKLRITNMDYNPRRFENENVNITTLPKGTVLFKGFSDPSKMITDFVGWHKSGMESSYVWTNYNVFFYPYPFVVDQIGITGEKSYMVTYVLQNDVNVVLGLLPSKNSRSDRQSKDVTYMRSCDKIKVSNHFEGISYDPCLNTDFIRQNKDVVGGIYLTSLDTDAQKQTGSYNIKYNKYRQYFQDRSNNTGVPEIILYPFKKRIMKEVEFNRQNSKNAAWMEEHIKDYNYMPINVTVHTAYSDSEFYEYVNNLLSPEGVETNLLGKKTKLHMTLDTKTQFYVIAEMASPETLKRCIPINIPDKLEYFAN